MKKKMIIVFIMLIVLVAIYLIYGYFTSKKVVLSKYIIESNKIPDSFNEFKIIQISDLHDMKHIDEIYNNVILENPDIIVMTGDMINFNSQFNNELNVIKFIKKLENKYPIYYINGNHELKLEETDKKNNKNNYEKYKNELIKNNVIMLDGEKIEIDKNGEKIYLYGLKETPKDYLKKNKNNISNKIEIDKTHFNILLAHNPLKFELYEKMGFNLVLSGHVHGGEIRMPFIKGVLSPDRTLFPKYSKGEYNINDTKMILSAGLGDKTFKFRINNPYDLVCITLRSK
ncbi:MAG: metallophosphoesterase [Clostridiales bacterium]|nr:metallophosphoesterase [Clostridiales bacterium]